MPIHVWVGGMTHFSSIYHAPKWQRVWGVEDPSIVDLSDEYTAVELFVDEPDQGHYHIFRYILETDNGGTRIVSEGIMLGSSTSPDRPEISDWAGLSGNLTVLSCIHLGLEYYAPESQEPSGRINDDPIIFLNFDPATTTARHITSLDYVPELVRERHLGSPQAHAKAV